MDRTRLKHPPARVGIGSEPGASKMQHPMPKAKPGDGLSQAGSEQPPEWERCVTGSSSGQGAKAETFAGLQFPLLSRRTRMGAANWAR